MTKTYIINKTKNYLNYIIDGINFFDDSNFMISCFMDSSYKKDFNNNLYEHIKKLSAVNFLNELTNRKDIDKIVYHAITFLFDIINFYPEKYKNNFLQDEKFDTFLNCSKQIALFFHNNNLITNKHWFYLIDNYIKSSESIPINRKNDFLNLFKPEKIANQYSLLLSISTKDEELFNFIKKSNYLFSQEDFIYAHLFELQKKIPYTREIIPSKDIDYLLLSSVANASSNKFQHFLEKFITSVETLNFFKEKLNSEYITNVLKLDLFDKIMISSNIEKSMEQLEKYSKYLQLEQSVGFKNEEKTLKINKI